jgi:hypothetical protein
MVGPVSQIPSNMIDNPPAMRHAFTRHTLALVVVSLVWTSAAHAADSLSGTWSSGDRSSDLTFVFRVQGEAFLGIVCGQCDDPASIFRIAEGRVLDAERISFFIVRDDGGPLFAKIGPYREHVSGTLSGTQLTLQVRREGGSEPPTRMVLNRVVGKRDPASAGTPTGPAFPAASAIDGRWVSVGRVAQQNLTLKVRGNRVSGVICGPCDDPNGVFLVEDGTLEGNAISFYIHHFDAPGLRRNFMMGTITENVIKFKWVREGRENEPGGEMTFIGPIRGPVAAAQARPGTSPKTPSR